MRINHGRTAVRADTLVGRLPVTAWHRQSAGNGAKGPRCYDWAWIHIGIVRCRPRDMKCPRPTHGRRHRHPTQVAAVRGQFGGVEVTVRRPTCLPRCGGGARSARSAVPGPTRLYELIKPLRQTVPSSRRGRSDSPRPRKVAPEGQAHSAFT